MRSDNNDRYNKINLNFEVIKPFIDRNELILNNKSFSWVADYESLKNFAKTIALIGKWSPGGRIRKFASKNVYLTIMWYYGKQRSLLLRRECAEMCKEMLVKVLKSYVDQAVKKTTNEASSVADCEVDFINQSLATIQKERDILKTILLRSNADVNSKFPEIGQKTYNTDMAN